MTPKKIDNPQNVRIYEQDFVNNVTVFIHDKHYKWQNVTDKLKWHNMRSEHKDCIDEFLYLSLEEIADQLSWEESVIMVMIEEPMKGTIYQYGNHGEYWEEVGELCGYA